MAGKLVRKGQAVYSADGAYVGRVLQCERDLLVVAESRWVNDRYLVAAADVAASGEGLVVLRLPCDRLRRETDEPWSAPRDPQGSAGGVDLEPLRAGMAEVEDARAATAPDAGEPPAPGRRSVPRTPAPDEASALDAFAALRLEADVEHRLADEVEDFERGAACAAPGAEP